MTDSMILKLGKLTQSAKVYRGVSGGKLPEACRKENEHGFRGGVEVRTLLCLQACAHLLADEESAPIYRQAIHASTIA